MVKYLGQSLTNTGLPKEIKSEKDFPILIAVLTRFKTLTSRARLRIFKTYGISHINHLLPFYSINNQTPNTWKYLRRIIFYYVLKRQTTPLEAMPLLGLGIFDLMIKPITKALLKVQHNIDLSSFLQQTLKRNIEHMLTIENEHSDNLISRLHKLSTGDLTQLQYINSDIKLSAIKRNFKTS